MNTTWETENVVVELVRFDHDLHRFAVMSKDFKFLGYITPAVIEDMESIITDLNSGNCPISDAWEDGNGNVCTMQGWDDSMDQIHLST